MIDKLITALSQEVEMSTEEIADTIWLALQIQEPPSESVASDFFSVKEDIGAIANKTTPPKLQPPTADSNETPKNLDSEAQKAKIHPRSQQQTESSDLSFKTPNAPSLRQPLTLARALKPLMRRIPGNKNPVLDETATIERIAKTKLWLPVLRPTLEPWLDLELVVDESISMQIWRQTIRDLEKLLKNYGIFRDVRVWGMTAKDGEKVEIRRGIGAAAKNQFPRSSRELIDGSSRRLVLVVSDCVSSYWRDGKVKKALEIWGNSVPTAIIQMLPKWLWKRTALGRASEVRLRALTPGVSNQNLIVREVSLWEELEEKKGIKVPIFTLEEDKATSWAQMLSGKSSVSTLGFVFKLDAPVQENSLFNLDYSQLSASERVQAFRVTASPMARKLAGLLAAAPVTLPVVRLIRAALLPESLQVNVAEVFLGGLLKPASEIKVDSNPDDVLYEFMDGVRDLLIDSMPTDRVLNVVDKVSEHLAERFGLSLENFAAVLRGEKEVEDSGVVGEVGYFATVTAEVLRCLGGEYEKVAEELEDNSREGSPAVKLTTVNIQALYQATAPGVPLFINNAEIDEKYYIDFSPVRGQQVIKKLKTTITRWSSDQPTCQLFTGHIGCGKSTELWRLKQQLETAGYHVVYIESEKNLEMVDVDVSDILLTIAQKVSESLEKLEKLNLEEPKRLKGLLQGVAKLFQTIELSAEANLPGVGKVSASTEGSFSAELGLPGIAEFKASDKGLKVVAAGIGKISAQAKGSPELRSKLREYLGPRTTGIIEMINKELLDPAEKKLKEYGKKGLVVIPDSLDRIESSPKPWGRNQQEYLFVDQGEQLTSLHCHVIYTLPLALRFSNDYATLIQRFGTPNILPMVATQLRDGSESAPGMELMQQLLLARAFPELEAQERLARVTEVFDSQKTLDYLCQIGGGCVRNMLRMVVDAIKEEDDLPISRASVDNVVRRYRNEQLLAVDDDEWELLRQVVQTKKVTGDDGYQTLIRSMFVYEYQDDRGSWFDINPLLKDALESQ